MDNSVEMKQMLDSAMKAHPESFKDFDRTKNVQDQLQAMVGYHLWKLNWSFASWLYDVDDDGDCDFHIKHEHLNFTSMEQLWLGYYMKTVHNKIWTGDKWDGKML